MKKINKIKEQSIARCYHYFNLSLFVIYRGNFDSEHQNIILVS